MNDLFKINEAIEYLKNGEIIVSNNKTQFVLKKEKIHVYQNGNHFVLAMDDFVKLYHKNDFNILKNDSFIDEDKDDAYYRYFKK